MQLIAKAHLVSRSQVQRHFSSFVQWPTCYFATIRSYCLMHQINYQSVVYRYLPLTSNSSNSRLIRFLYLVVTGFASQVCSNSSRHHRLLFAFISVAPY